MPHPRHPSAWVGKSQARPVLGKPFITIPGMSTILCRSFSSAILLVVLVSALRTKADVCVYKPPKVKRVCGVIVDSSHRPIPNVNVSVLKDGATVKVARTDSAGEFDLDAILAGKYELDIKIAGFVHSRYELTLSKPSDTCKHALEIEMEVGGVHCGGDIRLTNRRIVPKR